jgi:hypothetical protein
MPKIPKIIPYTGLGTPQESFKKILKSKGISEKMAEKSISNINKHYAQNKGFGRLW